MTDPIDPTERYNRLARVCREQRSMLDQILSQLKQARRTGLGRSACMQLELSISDRLARLDRDDAA